MKLIIGALIFYLFLEMAFPPTPTHDEPKRKVQKKKHENWVLKVHPVHYDGVFVRNEKKLVRKKVVDKTCIEWDIKPKRQQNVNETSTSRQPAVVANINATSTTTGKNT